MIERLSLNSLKFFYYVARYDSVTIAAEKLFVTQGAVSKQLKNLEEALGRRLFIRDCKKLQLTGDGLALFDCCEQVFPQIDQRLVQMTREKKNEKGRRSKKRSKNTIFWVISHTVTRLGGGGGV